MPGTIDFGDPIDFSPQQNNTTGSTRPSFDVRPRSSQPQSSVPREPAHKIQAVAPIFPRPSMTPSDVPDPVGAQVQSAQPGVPTMDPSSPQKGDKGVLYIIIGATAFIVLALIGYFVYTSLGKKSSSTNNQTNQVNVVTNTGVSNSTNTTNSTTTVKDPNSDPDNDGLTNQEEATYKTDANNPDSDSDGFKDGAEVEKGFNPIGTGKLTTPAQL